MTDIDIDKVADTTIAELQELGDTAKSISAVRTAWASETNVFKKVFAAVAAGVELISDVVHKVESLGVTLGVAGDKKRDLAVAVINKLLDIPYVPENVEAVLIGFTVDTVVRAFNRKFGKSWLASARPLIPEHPTA